jgi:hypothetical protein
MQQKIGTTRESAESASGRPSSLIPGYSILARLGRGGMGSVFKAIDLSKNRLVAIKFLPVSLAKDRAYIRRFLREAKNASQLSHPNITRVNEVGNYKGVFYFSMEYVDGRTLLSLIESETPPEIGAVIDIITQAAQGLEHAHSHNIIHRDIKPENIMIGSDGTVKICDMGLAKRMGSSEHDITLTGFVIGTPSYMSPEQITSPKSIDHRSDIYSLGATFYHAVTGGRPFLGATSAQTMLNVVRENLNFPKNTAVPAQIVKVIKKMMAKDPQKRYQSARELITELCAIKENRYGGRRFLWFGARTRTEPSAPSPPLGAAAALEKHARLPYLLSLGAVAVVFAVFIVKAMPSLPTAFTRPAAQVQVPPEDASAQEHINAGLAFASLFLWNEALNEFTFAAEANSLDPAAHNNRGTALFALGRFEEALVSFNEAVGLAPQDCEIHRNRGAVLLAMKKFDEALDEFERAASILPDNASAWFAKAQCLKEIGRNEESDEALTHAQKLTRR